MISGELLGDGVELVNVLGDGGEFNPLLCERWHSGDGVELVNVLTDGGEFIPLFCKRWHSVVLLFSRSFLGLGGRRGTC